VQFVFITRLCVCGKVYDQNPPVKIEKKLQQN
jgi:hypothetical protein